MKKNIIYLILFLFFLFIFSTFYVGLDKPNLYTPKEIKNKKLEQFSSNELFSNEKLNSNNIIKDYKFTLVNIWSSWCVPCKNEHFLLMDLKEKTKLNIIGLNYKDKKNNAIKFINELGNPFSKILTDPDGTISISLGAYGVPETFLLNNKSKVIKKYIGPLTKENVKEIIKIVKS
tara:strand:+ start:1591 stop:2115 length:525 start_codon:yes stop_codon:yes gene_type:complete